MEELETRVGALRQELLKAQTITVQQSLTAPVDGVVQQLKVHTIGGVVTPAEQLMVIVPQGNRSKSKPSSSIAMLASSSKGRGPQ